MTESGNDTVPASITPPTVPIIPLGRRSYGRIHAFIGSRLKESRRHQTDGAGRADERDPHSPEHVGTGRENIRKSLAAAFGARARKTRSKIGFLEARCGRSVCRKPEYGRL